MVSISSLTVDKQYKVTPCRKGFKESITYVSDDGTASVEVFITWRSGSLKITFHDADEIEMMQEIVSENDEFSDDSFDCELIDYFDEIDVQFNIDVDDGSEINETSLRAKLESLYPNIEEPLQEAGFKNIDHCYILASPLEFEVS